MNFISSINKIIDTLRRKLLTKKIENRKKIRAEIEIPARFKSNIL